MDGYYTPEKIALWMEQLKRETTAQVPGLEWWPNKKTDSCYLVGTRIGPMKKGVRHVNVMSQTTVDDYNLRDNFHQLQDRFDDMPNSDEAAFRAIETFRASLEEHLEAYVGPIEGKAATTYRARRLKNAARFGLKKAIDNMDHLIAALRKLQADLS